MTTLLSFIFGLSLPYAWHLWHRPRPSLARALAPRHTWVMHFEYGEHHISAIWHDWRDAREAVERAVKTIERLAEETQTQGANQ